MTKLNESYLKVHYEFRPRKQVERRMIVDAMHRLTFAGFEIRDYQYTGLGSIYFIDFIMFHKLLGINDMLSVEGIGQIKKRVEFNKPFDFIKIKMGLIGEVIPGLSEDKKHFLWLDYDQVLHSEILEDVYLASSKLSNGSLIMITIDSEPPNKEDESPRSTKKYYKMHAEKYLPLDIEDDAFRKSKLPILNSQIIYNVIKDGIAGSKKNYYQLFNFIYADGHEMITFGGMVGEKNEKKKIKKSKIEEEPYIRMDIKREPYRIEVPCITRKERLYLDSAMPCDDGWKPKEFDIPKELVLAYREIYRYFPPYAELLL